MGDLGSLGILGAILLAVAGVVGFFLKSGGMSKRKAEADAAKAQVDENRKRLRRAQAEVDELVSFDRISRVEYEATRKDMEDQLRPDEPRPSHTSIVDELRRRREARRQP